MPEIKDITPDRSLTTLEPSSRGLLREDVYRYLRNAIINGRYEPGERLRGADLAEELKVSRTPVREALRRLEDEGLIETWANRWTRVAPIDIAEAERIYPIIWTLERLALTEIETFPADRLAELEAANARLHDELEAKNPVQASEADRDFHQGLVDAAENPEITRISQELKARLRRLEIHYFGSLLAGESVVEHQAVIDALTAGDPQSAGEAVERNWRNSLARLQQRSP